MQHIDLELNKKKNIIKEKIINDILIGVSLKPKLKIEISSLSLFNLIKHNSIPKIIINGIIIVIIFGNKNNDK